MKVLVVGAGAVGQVYGYHLAKGGAELSFFVKEKYRDELRSGLTLYPWNKGKPPEAVEFRDYGVLSQASEVAAQAWDQVWLCVSSPALRGEWLGELVSAAAGARIVSLQPGLKDRELLLRHVPAERLVSGAIALISYQAPLPGEKAFAKPGVAYWFPPLSPSPFSGPAEVVQAIVQALKRGGCPARVQPDVATWVSFASSIMTPYLLGLEACGWSFRGLRGNAQMLELVGRTTQETLAIVGGYLKASPSPANKAIRPWLVSLALGLAPWIVPFDLEVYLKYHFTKVGDQTRAGVAEYLEAAASLGLPAVALAELRSKIS